MPVRRSNRNVLIAIFSELCSLFQGGRGRFAPKGDAARSIRSSNQKPHVRPRSAVSSSPSRRRTMGGERAGNDQVKAKATKPEQSRKRPATVTARKLLEANSSRMLHHLSRAPLRS